MSSNCMSKRPFLVDYHVHPDHSIDARGSVDEFCRAALSQGLSEICFTTHYDADPRYWDEDAWVVVDGHRVSLDQPWLHRYQSQIEQATATYGPRGLRVKLGLEVSYYPGVEQLIAEITAAHPVDYLLGAIHWVDGYPISYPPEVQAWLEGGDRSAAVAGYYRLLGAAAASGLFDCLAHLDLYRRTLRQADENELDQPAVRAAVDELLATCAARDVGIEINTRRAGEHPATPGPGPRLLRLAAEAGVRTVVTGSDAHTPESVAAGLGAGLAAAVRAGFTHLTTFDRRERRRHRLDEPGICRPAAAK